MRFDGYYLLADGLGIPNLQDRAFSFGQWQLRGLLFGCLASPPEATSVTLRRTLVAYAWAIWLYRLILFTGIAVMVYQYFFKALGIILFLVEIVWFIAMPIVREIGGWWTNRAFYATSSRAWGTAVVLGILLSFAFVPLRTSISVPAVLQATSYATIYAPMPGRVSQVLVRDGQRVMAGEQVVVLENPSLEKEVRLAEIKVAMWNYRLGRQAGHGQDRAQRQVIAESLKTGLTELAGLESERENLILKAPMAGTIRDRADSLTPGRWIDQKLPVAYLVDVGHTEIEGLVPVDELAYIDVGQSARFVPVDLTRPSMEAQITEVAQVDERDLAIPYFASIFGGDMAVRKDDKGRLKPEVSVYRVRLNLREAIRDADQAVPGHVQIRGQPFSVRTSVP